MFTLLLNHLSGHSYGGYTIYTAKRHSVSPHPYTVLAGLSLDPVYDGAPISTIASWVTIRDFAVSNNLTDTATQQLLDLIQAHLPLENSCHRTVYMSISSKTTIRGVSVKITFSVHAWKKFPQIRNNVAKRDVKVIYATSASF